MSITAVNFSVTFDDAYKSAYNSGNASGTLIYQSNSSTKYYYGWTSNSDFHVYWDTSDNKWHDSGASNPTSFKVSGGTSSNPSAEVSNSNPVQFTNSNGNRILYFDQPSFLFSASGPTVTSHTWNEITSTATVLTSDTVQSSDFTFSKGTSSYSPNSMNLIAYSDGSGYFYDYQHTTTDVYTATIDSKPISHFYYDDSWTSDVSGATSGRQTTSNRIVNVLGKIPSTTVINGIPNGYTLERTDRALYYTSTTSNIYIFMYVTGTPTNIVAKLVIHNNDLLHTRS
jgi:hypothetical protein